VKEGVGEHTKIPDLAGTHQKEVRQGSLDQHVGGINLEAAAEGAV